MSQTLSIRGFAAGLFNQRVRADAMQNVFALSQKMKGAKSEPLLILTM